MIAKEEMTVEVVTKEEIAIEVARMVEAGTVVTIVTGSVRSAITRTSLSEPNAIAVASLKGGAAGTIEELETEMTVEAVVEMTAEAVAEVTAETEMSEGPTEALTRITTGLVANVKTQTSHSELNATAVELLKEEVEAQASSGQAMNEEQVTEERNHNREQGIGNALSAENPILPSGMNALVVDVLRELVDPNKEGIIAN